MTLPSWHEEPIAKRHKRDLFDCGDPGLNAYLQKFARQSHESGGAKTFLAIADADGSVLGFYSITPAAAEYEHTPVSIRKNLPRYDIPGYRLARLATDRSIQGSGLGGQLLLAAGKRCLQVAAEVGGVALYIDAKNERAAGWYQSFGAERLIGVTQTPPIGMMPIGMIMPLKTIAAALQVAGKL